ncbi:MAG: alginate lyase family protein [Pirellulales bacterium]|nr:alginate lyase family protein [Pirellulales bacterium]
MALRIGWIFPTLLLAATVCGPSPSAAGDTSRARLFLLDAGRLAKTRDRVAAGDAALAPAVAQLRKEAERALEAGPFSVMDKKAVPPSGDKHDYLSVGPYWWPDPDKPDGKPYIRRDGEVNPERHQYDNVALSRMGEAVDTLALAYYLTGHEPYSKHAAGLLRTWFLDPDTRMNPHLEYGQAIPGRCDGRGIGIIDTTRLARLVDAVGMLGSSAAWTPGDQKGLQLWFRDYLKWLIESDHGRAESRTRNNHATWYDVQVVSFALFVGDEQTAGRVLREAGARRIATQIEPDGRQPLELARTKSFDYSTMNLRGMFDLATLGRQVGVDLWGFRTDDGRSIRRALDWLVAHTLGGQPWSHRQITRLRPQALRPLLRRAAIAYDEPRYEELYRELLDGDFRAGRIDLIYPAVRAGTD